MLEKKNGKIRKEKKGSWIKKKKKKREKEREGGKNGNLKWH